MDILRMAFIVGALVFGGLAVLSGPRALYSFSPRQIYQRIRAEGPPGQVRHGLYAVITIACAVGIYVTS
jgi:hypothetical protein